MPDKTSQEKHITRLVWWNRLWLILLLLIFLGFAARFYVKSVLKDIYSLNVEWSGDTLHVFSVKDGPFVVTHLVKLRSRDGEYAAALLPDPVTIIDSRGHHFSKADIDRLEWIGTSGEKQAAPTVGAKVKAFYFIPLETAPNL